jgi:hypothetical protein
MGETPIDFQLALALGDIPVRRLENFSIYERQTGKLVSIASLIYLQYSQELDYAASGHVSVWFEDNDIEDFYAGEVRTPDGEDEGTSVQNSLDTKQQIRLSKIIELNTLFWSPENEELDRYDLMYECYYV